MDKAGSLPDSSYPKVDMELHSLTMKQLFEVLETNGRRVTGLSIPLRNGAFLFWFEGVHYIPQLDVEEFIKNELMKDNDDRVKRGRKKRAPEFFGRSVAIEAVVDTGDGDDKFREHLSIRYTPKEDFSIHRRVNRAL
ncbi:hypothetical protein Mgra_00003623 [Meloidogyne graminicola]|uniref:Uncharacterized protein n=1 Tax=Meloidogyne graminicola TaxID=189291 RepID=A0A8S9ZUE1_9BILA|nr:hypothetical protein Mgra_00003623 [Meloidogyne graminicola]